MTEKIDDAAEVEIRWRAHGKDNVLTGVLSSFELNVDREEEEFFSLRSYLPSTPKYTLAGEFKLVNDKAFTIKTSDVKDTEVEYRAVVESTDRTVEAMEAARVRVGAPTSAKVRFFDLLRKPEVQFDITVPQPCKIEFVWWDKV